MNTSFEAVLQRLENNQLWKFPGGVHPPSQKTLSNTSSINRLSLPEVINVPVKQHTGIEGKIVVTIGQHVLKGEALSHSSLPYAVPVHAPTSGHISAIELQPSSHPSGTPEMTISLVPDGNDTWKPLTPLPHYQRLSKTEVIEAICDAGISGLGGAGFPTHIKVATPKPVEFLIINGIECEPYISSDDRLMREHAWQIRQGIDVLCHLLEPKCVIVAIEDNKPEAIQALSIACQDSPRFKVVSVPTVYPAGGEKQLVQVLTGREIPRNGLPIDVSCVMFNVGTCYAIADAIFSGKPLVERVVTVTGHAVEEPQNVWALLGTPVLHLLSHAGYLPHKQEQQQVIMGGPMMGFSVTNLTVPVVKITNCLLVPAAKELPDSDAERACIRCGFCADACPASLLPQQLLWYSKANDLDKAEEYNLFDCIECGACAYVCPSEIPLVHYYRKAKAEIRNQREEKIKAEKAKARFEARKQRLLEEKKAREEKHRIAAEQRKQAMASGDNSAKDKIAAALARAKAKKQQAAKPDTASSESQVNSPAEPTAVDTTQQNPDDKQRKVQAAIERAKAKKAKLQQASLSADQQSRTTPEQQSDNDAVSPKVEEPSESLTPEQVKQQKVAKAIERAKARKQQQTGSSPEQQSDNDAVSPKADEPSESLTPEQIKQQKVAKAIERAKARKQQQTGSSPEQQSDNDAVSPKVEEPSESLTPEQVKQQKVAKAIERAKARKQQQTGASPEQQSDNDAVSPKVEEPSESLTPEQVKQQKVAKAIERAKARKQQQSKQPDNQS